MRFLEDMKINFHDYHVLPKDYRNINSSKIWNWFVNLYKFLQQLHTSGVGCTSTIVGINETMIINTDNGTIYKNGTTRTTICSFISEVGSNISQFAFCKNVQILGKLELIGKYAISIQSCHGNITINSTQPVQVLCSENGIKTSCAGVNSCSKDNRSKFKWLFIHAEWI